MEKPQSSQTPASQPPKASTPKGMMAFSRNGMPPEPPVIGMEMKAGYNGAPPISQAAGAAAATTPVSVAPAAVRTSAPAPPPKK